MKQAKETTGWLRVRRMINVKEKKNNFFKPRHKISNLWGNLTIIRQIRNIWQWNSQEYAEFGQSNNGE